MVRRLPYLDGLRALAILMVVVYHAARMNPWLDSHRWSPAGFWMRQWHGVELFFVLSGFCLAWPVLERLRVNGAIDFDVTRFLAKRLARIVLPYWIACAMLATLLAILLRLHVQPAGSMAPGALAPVRLIAQMIFLDGHPQWVNGSFWTLAVEVRWYLAFPLLLWLWTKSKRAFLLAGAALWMLHIASRLDAPDTMALPAFMLGILAAHIKVHGVPIARFATLAFAAAFGFALLQSLPLDYPQPTLYWAIAMFLLVVAAGENRVVKRAFSSAPLRLLAAASYSIYLTHAPIMGLFLRHAPASLGVPVTTLCAIGVGIATGLAFWAIVERPLMQPRVREATAAAIHAQLQRLAAVLQVRCLVHLGAEKAPMRQPAVETNELSLSQPAVQATV